MQTTLPFDEATEKNRNFAGIVNGYDPRLFNASEQIIKHVQQLGPAADKAVRYHSNLYEGVPKDYSINRLYILNQRNREESVYAFV